MADLTIVLGQPVTATITGHSASNGANMPAGSTLAITSNDPTVATVDPIPDLTMDTATLSVPVNVLASGSTDLHLTVTAPDGTIFESTRTLLVGPVVEGLVSVDLMLTSP